jgi:5-methylcytosine-specific restriction endonuclease McrA
MAKNWRNTREYRVWRALVIRRDKRCVVCNSLQNRQAHHKNSASYFPDDRFDPENGVCLCRKCHTDFHTNFKRSFREKCTKYDYDNFITLLENICTRIIGND